MLPLDGLPPWLSQLDLTDRGQPRANLTNVARVLQLDPTWGPDRLWYDEFLDKIFVANSPTRAWTDEDDTRLTIYMQEVAGMATLPEHHVTKAVRLVAKQRSRHVVREWLTSLTWDQVPRIDHAFEDYWGAEHQPSDYVRAASRNFFLGLVARILRPGCKLDTMPVFEGRQGIKKSSALAVIGGEWYAVTTEAVSSKDFFQSLRGKWLLEISELQAFNRSDVSHVKSMMSTQADHYRPSYGRASVEFLRQCAFAGTTNADDWGTDETGLRRFWPITCGAIALDLLREARPQLFAEAVDRFRAGATWWEMPDATLAVQADRQADHAWTPLVLEGLAGQSETTTTEVLMRILRFDANQISRPAIHEVARILRLAGWTRQTQRRFGKPTKLWVSPDHGKD